MDGNTYQAEYRSRLLYVAVYTLRGTSGSGTGPARPVNRAAALKYGTQVGAVLEYCGCGGVSGYGGGQLCVSHVVKVDHD